MSLFMLGATEIKKTESSPSKVDAWVAAASTLAGGAVGALLWKKHPVLGLLNGFSLGGNVARAVTKEIPIRRALENIGSHAVATAGSLGLPAYPVVGYVAGAAASNLFLRRSDTYLERLDETVLGDARRGVSAGKRFLLGAGKSLDDVRAGRATVKRGDKGSVVEFVQKIVGAPVDGDFGPKTESAVRAFQAKSGLPVDGVVGKNTMAALDRGAGGVEIINFDEPEVVTAKSPGKAPSTALAVIPKKESDDGLLLGRPAWQVVLAGIGVAVAAGGVAVAVWPE